MPSRNARKSYRDGGYYHLYNRGVEKRLIFQDEQDYSVFLSYLKTYLLPKDENELQRKLFDSTTTPFEKDKILKLLRLNNFYEEIHFIAYCLMPNHFHFLVKQQNAGSIDKFMNSLGTRYTMYFNRKYHRVGPLYQDVYKAVLITTDEQLIHLSRYIHKQALVQQGVALQDCPSSYYDYIGERETAWVRPEGVLRSFSKTDPSSSYKEFLEQVEDIIIIQKLLLDE